MDWGLAIQEIRLAILGRSPQARWYLRLLAQSLLRNLRVRASPPFGIRWPRNQISPPSRGSVHQIPEIRRWIPDFPLATFWWSTRQTKPPPPNRPPLGAPKKHRSSPPSPVAAS